MQNATKLAIIKVQRGLQRQDLTARSPRRADLRTRRSSPTWNETLAKGIGIFGI